MTTSPAILSIQNKFEEACVELFWDINCEITSHNEKLLDTSDVPHAHIDGGCDDVEVDIYLSLPFSTLAMTYPSSCDIATIDELALEDWLCELANRLLGKLKRKLLVAGADLKMGLPEYFLGQTYHRKTTTAEIFSYTYEVDHELFEVVIAIELFNPNLLLENSTQAVAAQGDVADGDLELF